MSYICLLNGKCSRILRIIYGWLIFTFVTEIIHIWLTPYIIRIHNWYYQHSYLYPALSMFDSDSRKKKCGSGYRMVDILSVSVPFSPTNTITSYRCEDQKKQIVSLISYPNNLRACKAWVVKLVNALKIWEPGEKGRQLTMKPFQWSWWTSSQNGKCMKAFSWQK